MSKIIITLTVALIFGATANASSLDFVIYDAPGGSILSDNSVEFQSLDVFQFFSFQVWVDPAPGQYFKGISLFLTDLNSNRCSFMVGGRNLHGVSWEYGPYVTDPTTSDAMLFHYKSSSMYSELDPSCRDLGATTTNPAYGDPAGQLMTLTMRILYNVPVGQYTITPAGSTYVKNDNSAGQFDHVDEIIVNIVPEPVTLTLLTLGGIALIRRR